MAEDNHRDTLLEEEEEEAERQLQVDHDEERRIRKLEEEVLFGGGRKSITRTAAAERDEEDDEEGNQGGEEQTNITARTTEEAEENETNSNIGNRQSRRLSQRRSQRLNDRRSQRLSQRLSQRPVTLAQDSVPPPAPETITAETAASRLSRRESRRISRRISVAANTDENLRNSLRRSLARPNADTIISQNLEDDLLIEEEEEEEEEEEAPRINPVERLSETCSDAGCVCNATDNDTASGPTVYNRDTYVPFVVEVKVPEEEELSSPTKTKAFLPFVQRKMKTMFSKNSENHNNTTTTGASGNAESKQDNQDDGSIRKSNKDITRSKRETLEERNRSSTKYLSQEEEEWIQSFEKEEEAFTVKSGNLASFYAGKSPIPNEISTVNLKTENEFGQICKFLYASQKYPSISKVVLQDPVKEKSSSLMMKSVTNEPVATYQRRGCDIITINETTWFPSIGYGDIGITRGKYYYEVTIMKATHGLFQVGWAERSLFGPDPSFRAINHGIGDCEFSWAFDGLRCKKWNRGVGTPWGEKTSKGAVIGCAVDMDTKTISFSYQGNWENNMGVAFENVALATCVTPALSAHAGSKFKFNLGRKAFVHAPPDSKYKPLYSWIVDHTEKVVSHETKTFRNPAASLKTIHLTNTKVTGPLLGYLFHGNKFANLQVLQELKIGGNLLGEDSNYLSHIATLLKNLAPRLETLHLEDNNLRPVGVEKLMPLLTTLRDINLDKNGLAGAAGGEMIAKLIESSDKLVKLSLCGNYLGDSGSKIVLQATVRNKSLTELSLEKNDLGQAFGSGLAVIVDSIPHLASLNVRLNPRMLGSICNLLANGKHVQRLNLGFAGLTKTHVPLLTDAILQSNVKYLGLGGNQLGLEGYMSIVKTVARKPDNDQECSIDFSSNQLSEDECLKLLEFLAEPPFLLSCNLSGNKNVSRKVADRVVDLYRGHPGMPAINLGATQVGQGVAKALFGLGLSLIKTKSAAVALNGLFQIPWNVECDDLSFFLKLYDWLDSIQSNPTSMRPELRVAGDLVLKQPVTSDVAKKQITLPTRIKVLGDASFVGWDQCSILKGVERLEVNGTLWIEGCHKVTRLPKELVVGEHFVLYKTPVNKVRVSGQGTSRVKLVHLIDVPVSKLRLKTATLKLERCPNLVNLDPQIAQGALLVSQCPLLSSIPQMVLVDLQLDRCEKVEKIDPKVVISGSVSVTRCPSLKQIGPFGGKGLDHLDLRFCTKLSSIKTAAKSIVLENCPHVQRLPITKADVLKIDRCKNLQLPKGLVVSRTCRITRCAKVKTLPVGINRVSEVLEISMCNIKELPANCRSREIQIRHCTELVRLGKNVAPRRLTIVGCHKLTSLETDNIYKPPESSLPLMVGPRWEVTRCGTLMNLPQSGRLEQLDVDRCNVLSSIPEGLNIRCLYLSNCGGFTRFDSELSTRPEIDHLSLEFMPNLVAITSSVSAETLAVEDCPRLTSIDASVSGSLELRNLRNLRSLSNAIVEGASYVEITNCGISARRLEELEQVARHLEWVDEDDDFDYDFGEHTDAFAGVDDAVSFWEKEAKVDASKHLELDPVIASYYKAGLLKFLSKLRTSAEFQREETRQGLATRVVEVLGAVLEDPVSREEMLVRIVDSNDRCGDKPIWALNQCALLRKIVQARGDREALRKVGLSIYRLSIVQEHAREKIKELEKTSPSGQVDDVCVYLKFEIELRESLDLPVPASKMLFPAYIKIKRKELSACRKEALAIDDDSLKVWLENWPEWQRQDRWEFAQEHLSKWDDLEVATLNKRISLSLTNFAGDPFSEPIMLGKSGPFEFSEFLDRWITTGLDFVNVPTSVKDVEKNLKRVLLS